MRPRHPQLVESLAVRVTEEMAARLDGYVDKMQRRLGPDFEVQRAYALREILARALRPRRGRP